MDTLSQLPNIAQLGLQVNLTNPPKGGKGYRQRKEVKDYVRQRDNYTCQICGNPGYECDHIIPFAISHDSTPSNMRCICTRCNRILRRKRRDASPSNGSYPEAPKLIALRLKMGLTQRGLAPVIGCSYMTVFNVENSRSRNKKVLDWLSKRAFTDLPLIKS